LEIPVEFTTDIEKFNHSNHPKINYSHTKINDEIYIKPHKLLFETGIYKQNILVSKWKDYNIFFQSNDQSSLDFDPFAAGFYLVSRYEEYLPFNRDKYGRFEAIESLAYKNNFLNVPVVNEWAFLLASLVQEKYPNFNFPARSFSYISTIDIDSAYQYLHKGFFRTFGATVKTLLCLNLKEINNRYRVLNHSRKDPFDTYDYFDIIHQKYNINSIYFFHVGKYGKYDKSISIKNSSYQSLIKNKAESSEVGIHSSYGSACSLKKLEKEIKIFSTILNKKIYKNRQHYLKLSFPATYSNLIRHNINEDYSMGYASELGFRAGICTSYIFYDLQLEKETGLKVVPFQIMDGTLNYYLKLRPEEAVIKIENMVNQVKKVNGTFVSIWHNESVSNQEIWKGWKWVYEEMLKMVKS